jgi:hypothetical protein
MKKFIAGALFGGLIAMALPVSAEVASLVGAKVAGETTVTLNGSTVGTAIIVDNKSYLPVRDTAVAFGAEVTPSAGEISLTTKISNDAIESELYTLRTDKADYENRIAKSQSTIKNLEEVVIPKNEKKVAESRNDAVRAQNQKFLDDSIKSLADQKQKLAEYQAKLEAINARIAELEAQ